MIGVRTIGVRRHLGKGYHYKTLTSTIKILVDGFAALRWVKKLSATVSGRRKTAHAGTFACSMAGGFALCLANLIAES
jgi:hypothetical protein